MRSTQASGNIADAMTTETVLIACIAANGLSKAAVFSLKKGGSKRAKARVAQGQGHL